MADLKTDSKQTSLKAVAKAYVRDKGGDCVHIPGGVGECVYNFAGCDVERAFLDGAAVMLERAAKVAETEDFVNRYTKAQRIRKLVGETNG
jgi:hypothetical protein